MVGLIENGMIYVFPPGALRDPTTPCASHLPRQAKDILFGLATSEVISLGHVVGFLHRVLSGPHLTGLTKFVGSD